jgi:hypothetical protein
VPSRLPAKDDVVVVLIGAPLLDHPAKALPHCPGGSPALSRQYTHRVAISNRRLIACDEKGVTFKWNDDRLEGPERYKVMTLPIHEFIRRFLVHLLRTPAGRARGQIIAAGVRRPAQ